MKVYKDGVEADVEPASAKNLIENHEFSAKKTKQRKPKNIEVIDATTEEAETK